MSNNRHYTTEQWKWKCTRCEFAFLDEDGEMLGDEIADHFRTCRGMIVGESTASGK